MAASTNDATYWVVAIPNWASSGTALRNRNQTPSAQAEEAKLTRRALDMKASRFSDNFDFRVPLLRVGTLDTLMTLSDDLGKIDQSLEGVVKKIRRTYAEMKGRDSELKVLGTSPQNYIERWEWDAATLPPAAPLKDLATQLSQDAIGCEDELKKKVSKYTEVTNIVSAIERKESGTLLVKPLGGLVKPDDIIEREYITTLLVIVPRVRELEFVATYETLEDIAKAEAEARRQEDAAQGKIEEKAPAAAQLKRVALRKQVEDAVAAAKSAADEKRPSSEVVDLQAKAEILKNQLEEEEKEAELERKRRKREAAVKNIVPRSAKRVAEDTELAMYRILVFKKGADTIRNLCREKRFNVRTYDYDPDQEKNEKQKKNILVTERNQLLGQLIVWLEAQYSQMFKAWIHVKAIRTFVEAVLRFGIPVNFQAIVLRPKKGLGQKLRLTLGEMYGSLAGGAFSGAESSEDTSGGEFYPYVYMSIDLKDE